MSYCMETTTNVHHAKVATAKTLSAETTTLTFKGTAADYQNITFFVPASVAEATAKAFNDAMAAHEAEEAEAEAERQAELIAEYGPPDDSAYRRDMIAAGRGELLGG